MSTSEIDGLSTIFGYFDHPGQKSPTYDPGRGDEEKARIQGSIIDSRVALGLPDPP